MRKIVLSLLIFAAILMVSNVCAQTTVTSGGTQDGIRVQSKFWIHQDIVSLMASDIHFKIYQKESNISINGWEIEILGFTTSTSASVDEHTVQVDCDGGNVPYCTYIYIEATLWLTGYNTVRIKDIQWTFPSDPAVDLEYDFGWTISAPNLQASGEYTHTITIHNDGPVGINIPSIAVVKMPDFYVLCNYDSFGTGLLDDPDTTFVVGLIGTGESIAFDFVTDTYGYGEHIYGGCSIDAGEIFMLFDHTITRKRVPSLTTWGIIILIALLLLSTIYAVYRRKQTA